MAGHAKGNFVVQIGDRRINASLSPGTPLMQDIKVASNTVSLDAHLNMEGVYYASLTKDSNPAESLICLVNFSFRETNQAEMMTFTPKGAPRAFEDHGIFGDVTLTIINLLRKFQDFGLGDNLGIDLKTQLDNDVRHAKYIYNETKTQLFISLPGEERMPVELSPGTQIMQDIRVASNVVDFGTEVEAEGVYWGTMPGQDILCLINFSFRGGQQGEMMTFSTDGSPRKFESFGLSGEVDIILQGVFRKFRNFGLEPETTDKPLSLKNQLDRDVARVKALHKKEQDEAWFWAQQVKEVTQTKMQMSGPTSMFGSMFGNKSQSQDDKSQSEDVSGLSKNEQKAAFQKQPPIPQYNAKSIPQTPAHFALSSKLSSLEGMLSSSLSTLLHIATQLQDATSEIKKLRADFESKGAFQSMNPATPVRPQEAAYC